MSAEEQFAKVVREFRITLGMSQQQVADEMAKRGCPVHQTVIHKIEKASRTITLNEAVALADILHISLSGLLQQGRRDEPSDAVLRTARLDRALWQIATIAQEATS